MPTEEDAEETKVQLDVKKLVPLAMEAAYSIKSLTGFEQAFVVSAIAWSIHQDRAEDFLEAAQQIVPQIRELNKEQV